MRNRLAAAPRDLQALTDLGMLYSHTRDWGMAASAFAYAHAMFPGHFASANNLCVALSQMDRPREVLKVIRPLLENDPANPSLLEHAARYSLAIGATNDAVVLARRWREAAPADPNAGAFLSALEGKQP